MKNSYQDSLNLPKTDFSMKANLSKTELDILERWQEINLFEKIKRHNKGKKKFILHDGPPYANGNIHIGHALNKIIKDVINKIKLMEGFDVVYVPGWDCHGLPIEHNIEKKYGRVGKKLLAKEFRQACREHADKYIENQKKDFKRLGILGDWDNEYQTKNFLYEANIIRSLGKVFENDHIIYGYKPVHWCLDCSSALAEAEIEYYKKDSLAVYVKFQIADNAQFKLDNKISLVIWTTTPWTLPSNEAIAISSDFSYVLFEYNNEYLIIVEDLLAQCLAKFKIQPSQYKIKKTFLGKDLDGLLVKHPFYEKEVPIVISSYITKDEGTGIVHTAPAHGLEDYQLGQKYNLPITSLVNDNGVFNDKTMLFAGEFIFKANDRIKELMIQNNSLLFYEKITHSYPHCWRHKTPVIFRATPQWFISMDKNGLRKKTISSIAKVKWHPKWGEGRIKSMIDNRPDWCISRQRAWGVPITFFINKKNGKLHSETLQLIEKIAKKVEQKGIEAYFDITLEQLGIDGKEYRRVYDVLDVWFDSGVSHFAVLNNNKDLSMPADLYLEGSDQHRGWFQSSLLTSCAMNGISPFKSVITHGFAVDENGKKMSKSLGNVIPPQEIINKMGADILRLWVCSSDYGNEISISNDILKRVADNYRKIRNTIRFMLANMYDFDSKKDIVPLDKMLVLDRWIITKVAQAQKEVIKDYNEYNFHIAIKKIVNLCVNELASFYLDIIKDRQYTSQKKSLIRKSTQTALFYISSVMVRLLSPVLSFTCEQIWQHLSKIQKNNVEESIFLSYWYKLPEDNFYSEIIDIMRELSVVIRQQIELLRNKGNLGSSLEAVVTLYCDDKLFNILSPAKKELHFILICSQVHIYKLDKKVNTSYAINKSCSVLVEKSCYEKCVRCWHHLPEVSENNNDNLCNRCYLNLYGQGENRNFA